MRKISQPSLAIALAVLGTLAMMGASARQPSFAVPAPQSMGNTANFDGHGNGRDDNQGDDQGDNHGGDQNNQGNGGPHDCTNPAGHQRGWCKHDDNNQGGNTTISGTVLGMNRDIVRFRLDNGSIITVNDRGLQRNGSALNVGSHYTLGGHYAHGVFIATNTNGYTNGYGGQNSNSNASVHGIITSVNGNNVTILQGLAPVTINDQPAMNNGQANNLYVTRTVTAYGYWNNGTFYATSIQ